MPKQIHKIDEFHGGVNDNADPRDILNNELAAAENVAVSESVSYTHLTLPTNREV